MKSLLSIVLIFISQTSFAQALWADGACNGATINEGATRDYVNRGTGIKWQNHLGDWRDKNNTAQGSTPYAQFSIPDLDKEQSIKIDVTQVVQEWVSKQYDNNGFFIKRISGGATSIYTQESSQPEKAAQLTITTSANTYQLAIDADTYLNGSTYRCLGNKEGMSTSGNMLLYFDISSQNIQGVIQSAQLQLVTFPKQYGKTATVAVYRAAPSLNQYDVAQKGLGLAAEYPNDYTIQNDSRVYLSEPFEKSDWGSKWTFGADKETLSTIDNNDVEQFSPLQGKALQAQLPEGALTALNLNYVFKDELGQDLEEVYFRYYIRFGNNWQTIEGGKLPGIAGTYGGEDFAGGWGGRTSDGTNGWSARGIYRNVLQAGNPHSGKIPIGNYLYHTDMEGHYGDVVYWDGEDRNALEKNRWYAIEQYVKLNTPGKNDGILRAWIDGHPVYEDANLSFRNEGYEHIKIEKIWMNIYHGGTKPIDRTVNAFIDNVVIASEYIGPLVIDPNLPTAGNEPNQLPTIENTLPVEDSLQLNLGETVNFSANIFDADGDLESVKWFKNGAIVAEDQSSYSFTPSLSDLGKHIILVEATDKNSAVAFHEWEVELNTQNIVILPITEDTHIEKSTYKASGYLSNLKSRGTMYFKLAKNADISVDDISTANLILFNEKQYGELKLSSYKATADWQEGQNNFDGVTREYKDYQQRVKWQNYLGDWTDAKGVQQGYSAFDSATIPRLNEAKFVEINVTNIIKHQWNNDVVSFALGTNGVNHSFASVNHQEAAKRPTLMLTLNNEQTSYDSQYDHGYNVPPSNGGSPIPSPPTSPDPIPPVNPALAHNDNLTELATQLDVGEWGELLTRNLSRDLLKVETDGKFLHIGGWTDDAVWDARNKQLLFMGFRKSLKMLAYSQESNQWNEIPADLEWPITSTFGHVYGNNAFDASSNSFYHHGANAKLVYRYNTETAQWSTLPEVPLETGELGTSIEYFPELGGLVRVARSGVQLYSGETKQWKQLATIKDMGYHSLVRYNPVRKEILVAGGNYAPDQFAVINQQGDIRYLSDIQLSFFPEIQEDGANEPLKMGIRVDKLLVHPVTGHYLIFTENKLYDFDSEKLVLTEITDFTTPFNNYDKPFTTTINSEGVVMFVDKQVLLYKPHDIQTDSVP